MRCRKVEKASFHFGVTESAKLAEFVFCDGHTLKAEDRCAQLSVVANASQPVGFATTGIELEPGARLLRESARTVMFGREFEVPPLNFAVVLVEILNENDCEIQRRDLELATEHYRPRGLSEKARAGFELYARRGETDRLRRIRDDRELSAAIFSL